ncbi:unnamed protein product [Penicillium olsonii]|nr:unnamed protein product [Penicillium olsonii]CAG7930280.1 unnamed protein product [Penicillium olsonii]
MTPFSAFSQRLGMPFVSKPFVEGHSPISPAFLALAGVSRISSPLDPFFGIVVTDVTSHSPRRRRFTCTCSTSAPQTCSKFSAPLSTDSISIAAPFPFQCPSGEFVLSPSPNPFQVTPAHNMLSASYRLESFRPWNLPQEKVQPLRDCLSTRYPSPVSISATPSPSNLSNPVSETQEIHASRLERHPLPVRPPAEVCFNGGPQPNAQITRQEPEILEPTSPTYPGHNALDFEDSLFLNDPLSFGDGDHAMTCEQIVPDSEHQFLGLGGSEIAFTPDQHSQFEVPEIPLESSMHTGNFAEDLAIDPAILDDNRSRDVELAQTTPTTNIAAAIPSRIPAEHSRSPVRDAHHHTRQHDPRRPVKVGQPPAKISKVSVVVDNRPQKRARRSTLELGRKNISLPAFRAQFSALPAEERLQFLSWLFEGALSHCIHTPPRRDTVPTSRSQKTSINAQAIDAGLTSSRKGLPWCEEEVRLLVKLKEEENLAWPEVAERFGQKFRGRSQGSIQVYWSTKLRK